MINGIHHKTTYNVSDILKPPGLTNKRQWYLFDKIRPYCSEETKDLVCPQPLEARESFVPPEEADDEPPTKKQGCVATVDFKVTTDSPAQKKNSSISNQTL